MCSQSERDAERQAWNEALASGDAERIERTRDAVLDSTHRRIMNDDPNYGRAGWDVDETPERPLRTLPTSKARLLAHLREGHGLQLFETGAVRRDEVAHEHEVLHRGDREGPDHAHIWPDGRR